MPTDNRPVIALDVDGVLSPFCSSKQRSHLWYHEKWRRKAVRWGLGVSQLIVNPEAAIWLQKLAFDTGAQLVWATHWNEDANTHVAPLITLPQLPVVVTPAYPRLKAPALIEWSAGRPLAWFDDESREVETAIRSAAECGQPFLGVLTDPKTGLMIKHVKQAREWLISQAASVARPDLAVDDSISALALVQSPKTRYFPRKEPSTVRIAAYRVAGNLTGLVA